MRTVESLFCRNRTVFAYGGHSRPLTIVMSGSEWSKRVARPRSRLMKAIASGEMDSSPLRCFCWLGRPAPMNVALTAKVAVPSSASA